MMVRSDGTAAVPASRERLNKLLCVPFAFSKGVKW
jgi:hypothetical protein